MDLLATTSMLAAAICWLLPLLQRWRAEHALEWRLLAAPLAAVPLLIWLEDRGSGGLVRWAWSLAAIGLVDLGTRACLAQVRVPVPRWTMTSAAVLAAGLLWHDAGARETPLDTIAVDEQTLADDELDAAPVPRPLQTIVVTGEKPGRSLNGTASSVAIVTREDLGASSDAALKAALKDVVAQLANVVSAGSMLAVFGRHLADDVNSQGAIVAASQRARRYREARSFGATLEWTL